VLYNSSKKYHVFLSWVNGVFDLYLQDKFNGLHVFFIEGDFHIKNEVENVKVIVEINLESKVLENGQMIFDKIISIYNLLLKN
jgi:hypothetical protein